MKWIKSVYNFYIEGFRNMPQWGRNLWIIVLLKLFIMFAVLKMFFFRDTLKSRFSTDEERANHVIEQLINN